MGRTGDTKALLPAWKVFIVLLGVFLLCYTPVLITSYGFSDDYAFLTQRDRGEAGLDTSVIAKGRPTYAVLIYVAFSYLHTVSDLRYLRLFGICLMTLLAWSLHQILVRQGWNRYQALFLSIIVCTLPPFQVYAAFAMVAFYPLAALLSGGAFYLADHAFEESRVLYKLGLAVGAVLLMGVGLTIHQSAGMFFWVFAAVSLFKPEARLSDVLPRFLWYGIIVFAGLCFGFTAYKLGMAVYGTESVGPLRSTLTTDIAGKVLWFLRWPLIDALNIHNLFPERWFTVMVGIFVITGLLWHFRGRFTERLVVSLGALLLLPLSYLPNLVVAENWSSYRTQSTLTSLIVVYVFFAAWGYRRFLPSSFSGQELTLELGIAALISSILATYNVTTYFTVPQARELAWIRTQLAQADLTRVHSIYIIGVKSGDTLAPALRYDEFGLPSSAQPWCPWSMVHLSLQDMEGEQANKPIETTPADGPIKPPPDALVIDMRRLLEVH